MRSAIARCQKSSRFQTGSALKDAINEFRIGVANTRAAPTTALVLRPDRIRSTMVRDFQRIISGARVQIRVEPVGCLTPSSRALVARVNAIGILHALTDVRLVSSGGGDGATGRHAATLPLVRPRGHFTDRSHAAKTVVGSFPFNFRGSGLSGVGPGHAWLKRPGVSLSADHRSRRWTRPLLALEGHHPASLNPHAVADALKLGELGRARL